MLLTGLYQPQSGEICWMATLSAANNRKIIANFFRSVYRCLAVRSTVGAGGSTRYPQLIEKWLVQLKMAHKLELATGVLLT